MATALEDLALHLDEAATSANFVSVASSLRPRLGHLIDWNNIQDNVELFELARSFMNIKDIRYEMLYGSLFIRVLADFERFIRRLVENALEEMVRGATYNEIKEKLGMHNLRLTGRVLASVSEPRDHLKFDYQNLVENLATCKAGTERFKLNAPAFSAAVVGGSPSVIERALKNIDVDNWWDEVGANKKLQVFLGTKKPRDTANLAKQKLTELWRVRNMIAHASDEVVEVSETKFRDCVEFIRAFSAALSSTIMSRATR